MAGYRFPDDMTLITNPPGTANLMIDTGGAKPDRTRIQDIIKNPTIEIRQGGATKGSFSLNQATGAVVNLDAGGETLYAHAINFVRGGFNVNTAQNRIEITGGDLWIVQEGYRDNNPQNRSFFVPAGNYNFAVVDDDWYIVFADTATWGGNGTLKTLATSNGTGWSGLANAVAIGAFFLNSGQIEGFHFFNGDVKINGQYPNASSGGSTPNNPTIIFQQGGVTKGSITLNQPSNQTINFDAGGSGSSATMLVSCANMVRGGFNINTVLNRIEIANGIFGGLQVFQGDYSTPSGQNRLINIPAGNYNFDIVDDDLYIVIADTASWGSPSGTLKILATSASIMNWTNGVLIGTFLYNDGKIEGFHFFIDDIKINGAYPFSSGSSGSGSNLFNPATALENTIISVIDGSVVSAPSGYTASGIITGIVVGATYTILGLPFNALTSVMNMRFIDSSNIALKPLLLSGVSSSDFSVPYTFPATSVKAPVGAVGFQFMLRNDSGVVLDLNNVQVYKQ